MYASWQWAAYVVAICTFHLLEFFVTVVYNPAVASADSFLVNHSTAFTAAAVTSWIEFVIRFVLCPGWTSPALTRIGLAGVVASQWMRASAMATAGESFNHYIQTSKKSNHRLVTNGVYRYLRHPSYVGFFYWCIATQMLLGNYVHACLYAGACWDFFRKRIAYEEESLCQFFPDEYPEYVSRTYIGIPFLFTSVKYSPKKRNTE
jgi:protein-S-isoprenylcysteine O-methyltransferase